MRIDPALRDYLISAPGMIPVPLGLVQHLGRKEAYMISYFIKANLQNGTRIKYCMDVNGDIIKDQKWSKVPMTVLRTQVLKSSLSTVERCLLDLVSKHLIFKARLNKIKWNHTRSYCVNLRAVIPLMKKYHISKIATESNNVVSNIGGISHENY